MRKQTELQKKVVELQLRALRQRQSALSRGNDYVPSKKRTKSSSKLQNTFASNLKGVPGGSAIRSVSELRMIEAPTTGCKTRAEEIGLLRSARNSNTTQGSYISTVVQAEDGRVESDLQGRKAFGR